MEIARPSSPDDEIVLGLHRFLRDTGVFDSQWDPAEDAEALKMPSAFFKDYLVEQARARTAGSGTVPPIAAQGGTTRASPL